MPGELPDVDAAVGVADGEEVALAGVELEAEGLGDRPFLTVVVLVSS
eukprot:CAMPEP_0198665168 /NCGR_PEP_ID=MMETSP1467-20131203/59328_1 /TAXON_ID=1462469 /ORGANISM="unid. sp., Strain CCMP2135" /LENGTH=46 /DNA_ID= /DNA_START= /DNA_END= /DNA_ORIENTATION=